MKVQLPQIFSLLKISQIALLGSAVKRRPRRACNEIVSPHSPARRCALRRDSHPTAPTSGFFGVIWVVFAVVFWLLVFLLSYFCSDFLVWKTFICWLFCFCVLFCGFLLFFFVASIVVLVLWIHCFSCTLATMRTISTIQGPACTQVPAHLFSSLS